jgi:hypothetical protein
MQRFAFIGIVALSVILDAGFLSGKLSGGEASAVLILTPIDLEISAN